MHRRKWELPMLLDHLASRFMFLPHVACFGSGQRVSLMWNACTHQAGMRILQQGGNAADAAVAVAAALNVTEPCSTGAPGRSVARVLFSRLQGCTSAGSAIDDHRLLQCRVGH